MANSSLNYHLKTSYDRNKMGGHFLDWANQPNVFKDYPGIETIKLPSKIKLPEEKLSTLLQKDDRPFGNSITPDLEDLSRVLLLTYSLTAKARHSGGDFYYRSAASAGALYPTEIYLALDNLKGLNDGLYHFPIGSHGLTPIRHGNLSEYIARAILPKNENVGAVTFFFSAIFFRSSWKYRERSFRYHLLDTGHVIENMALALKSQKLPFKLTYDFNDAKVNRFLGLDESKEAALAIVQILPNRPIEYEQRIEVEDLPEKLVKTSQVAEKEIDYPLIEEIYRVTSDVMFTDEKESSMVDEMGIVPEEWTGIDMAGSWPETMNFSESIFNRRSKRNYVPKPLSDDCLTALLQGLCSSDRDPYKSSLTTGFLLGKAENHNPGFYMMDTFSGKIGLRAPGLFTETMAQVCLNQSWLTNAAIHFLFMADLEKLKNIKGDRGYRYAMMRAGRLGERLYLMATSLNLGCCGIGAYYDNEAANLLELAENSKLLYLVAVGHIKG